VKGSQGAAVELGFQVVALLVLVLALVLALMAARWKTHSQT
jgi:hypothetical protein